MARTISTLLIWLLPFAILVEAQTVITGTNYTTTELECVSAFVVFPDGTRYFSGLVVKQGTRLYYLNSPYTLEVINTSIVFDDPDAYTDLVTVQLGRTGYADMDEFKEAAVGCLATGGDPLDFAIDSISYYGDTLYVYAGGDPVPFTTYIDSCPCEDPVPPADCVYVLGDPDTGEVVGDPDTGEVLFVANCDEPVPLAYALGDPDTGEVIGNPATGQVVGWFD